ncbi:Deleted in malignant brain tumors 1 protein-like [Mactra antiquata]
MGGYTALPVEALGREYMVMSYKPKIRSELQISSVAHGNRVTIQVRTTGTVTHKGITYRNGQIIREYVDRYQTWSIQSSSDLTGSLIKADQKIAVFSGGECISVPEDSPDCDFAVEQLPPTYAWESDFIVPLVDTCANVIRMLGRDDGTSVKITYGDKTETISLHSTEYTDRYLDTSVYRTAVIQSTRPILVTHLTGSQQNIATPSDCGPSMTLVPAIKQYSDNYHYVTENNLTASFVKIIIVENKAPGLRMNNQSIVVTNGANVLVGKSKVQYSVIDVDIPTDTNGMPVIFSHTTGIHFGAIFYGYNDHNTLSLPLGMQLDMSKENDKIRLVNGSTPTSGRVEVFHQGHWGTVCDLGFDAREVSVICRILGYFFGAADPVIHLDAFYGEGTGNVMVDNLNCLGTEDDLHVCRGTPPWENSACPHSKDVGVDCHSHVRVTGTNDTREGRLEILYNNIWGSVCDDDFTREAAAVACASMGFEKTGYFYTGGGPPGSVQWLDDIDCTGEETDIAQCMVKTWGASDCDHNEDVWVACYDQTKIRLAGGRTPSEGRLEVYAKGQWNTVCDNMFDKNDAKVVCNMLGYWRKDMDVEVYPNAYFGQGSGNVIIDELSCTGNEEDIADCKSKAWMLNSCTHANDVGVRCETSVRLTNGTDHNTGRLEVFYKGHWGSVCDDTFDKRAANVVCKQLGYKYGVGLDPVKHNSTYGSGTGRMVVSDVQCQGNETDFGLCSSKPWLQSNCSNNQVVGLDCGSSLRLVGGSTKTEGRLEVYYDGQWGTVCSDKFDAKDADVVCNQMGYRFGGTRKVHKNAYYGQGNGSIVIDELQCAGDETDVQFCISDPWLSNDCAHAQDVGIDCGLSLPDALEAGCTVDGWQLQIDIRKLERVLPTPVPTDVYMGQTNCKGTKTNTMLTFFVGLDDCNTTKTTSDTNVLYTNQLLYNDDLGYSWTIFLECAVWSHNYTTIRIGSSNFHEGSSLNETFLVKQALYSTPDYTNEISASELNLYNETYVKVYTPDADNETKLVINSCYVSPNHPLIQDGCSVDDTVHILERNKHEMKFVFSTSVIDFNLPSIFIHCDADFCDINDSLPKCIEGCTRNVV